MPVAQLRDPTEERGLIAAAQAGDERAFRDLVEPHRRALEVHAYRMLGSPHDAEDVVQETLMRAWKTLERFERRASIETWLYRIATNACLDELERRPRRPEPVYPYPDERLLEAETPVVDPAARYAMREGVELAFLTAIQRLPGRQRAILILRDVLGWSSGEVAELLESTVAAVNSGLQRARATIDTELPASSSWAAAPSQRHLLAGYVDAWERADMDDLIKLLREDAVLRMPPPPSIAGAAQICHFFATGPCGGGVDRVRVEPTWANGRAAVAMFQGEADGSETPHGLLLLEVEGDRIAGLDAFIDGRLVSAFSSAGDR
ncbi:MAG: sigma-70 family RNA polymerase sigma factor [Vicinamibacteria bacterium]